MADLIAPHGGLSEPVCCTVAADQIDAFKTEAADLKKVPVSAADLSSVYRFADGTLSPLTGPMDQATYNRVLEESVIENNGEKYAWTIPIAFPVTAEVAGTLSAGEKVALTNPAGEVVATLQLNDVYEWDKQKYISSVYLTDRTDHPGADMVLVGDADKTHLIGGEMQALPQPKNANFGQYVLTPREVRKLLAEAGWDAAVAFQTRNPLHRAHEYALVYALEKLLKEGKNAGAVLNPLIGETKGDDVNAEIRMQTYETLISERQMATATAMPSFGVHDQSPFQIASNYSVLISKCSTVDLKKLSCTASIVRTWDTPTSSSVVNMLMLLSKMGQRSGEISMHKKSSKTSTATSRLSL